MEISEFFKDDDFRSVRPLFEVAKGYKPDTLVYPSKIWQFDDAMDGGFRNGELVVISGQTGHGKTTWCQWLTKKLDASSIPSLWFSFEMDQWHLKEKFIKMGCDKTLLAYSPIELANSEMKFIEQQIDVAVKEYACKVIFIDHLHYLIPLNQSMSTSLLIGGIVRELKKLAVKKKVVICLIAHTKKIYQDEKLELSSIRDSSLIAQESDYVFLVERLKANEKKLVVGSSGWTNKMKVQLAKNRRTGKLIYLEFDFEEGNLVPVENFLTQENAY